MHGFVSGAHGAQGCRGVSNGPESCRTHTCSLAFSHVFHTCNMHVHGLSSILQYSLDATHTQGTLHVEVVCVEMHVEFLACSSELISTIPKKHDCCGMADFVCNQKCTHVEV